VSLRSWAGLAALLATSCGTHVSVTLLLPDSPKLEGLDSYSVALSWDGGRWDASVPFVDGTVSVSPIRPPATFDLEVLGIGDAGVTWRGLARGLSPDTPQPTLFFGKVNAFSSYAQMPNGLQNLSGSSASPLGPGQVLVIGGVNAAMEIAKLAVIYDHPSASFLAAPSPADHLSHHLALPLALFDPAGDEEWLLVGGDASSVNNGTHAEIYSRSYGGETQPPLPAPQISPSGSWTDFNGKRAAVGCGVTADGDAGVLAFNPGSGFEPLLAGNCSGGQLALVPGAGLVVIGLDGGVAVLLDGGVQQKAPLAVTGGFRSVVYQGTLTVVGGVGPSGVTRNVQRVWPASASGLLAAGRANFSLLLLDSGRVLVVGGQDETGAALASAEMLDLNSLTSLPLPAMSAPRINPAVSEIPGYGAALIISGEDDAGQPAGGFEVFTYQ
jgi:hypothetical protein